MTRSRIGYDHILPHVAPTPSLLIFCRLECGLVGRVDFAGNPSRPVKPRPSSSILQGVQAHEIPTLATHPPGRLHHVHDRVHRPDERVVGSPFHEQGAQHEPHASGRGRGSFFLGIRGAANSGWVSGAALERQAVRLRVAGGVGCLFGGLRPGAHLAAILGDAPLAGRSGGRGVARRIGIALPLVPARRTSASQRLLDALPSRRGDRLLPPFGMDLGPMELARAADCRRRPPFLLAGDLVGLH